MFSEEVVGRFYVFQLACLLVWTTVACRSMQQIREFQHEQWQITSICLFVVYCLLEFVRVVDTVYTDLSTGHIYTTWGIVPMWARMYAWILRDVILFKAINVYLEHAFVWTHLLLGAKVPRHLLTMQSCCCYLGNIILGTAATLFMVWNDQFWQPVCVLGQLPTAIMLIVNCTILHDCLKRVPDCKERRQADRINKLMLGSSALLLLVFPTLIILRMIELYGKPLAAVASASYGSSILAISPPSIFGIEKSVDLSMEIVEVTIGGVQCLLLLLRPLRHPRPGEPLVTTSEDVGRRIAARAATKKVS